MPSFFYAIVINKNKAMDKGKLKVLLFDLKNILNELESEVYSDTSSYVASAQAPLSDYEEIFEGDDDGYADWRKIFRRTIEVKTTVPLNPVEEVWNN